MKNCLSYLKCCWFLTFNLAIGLLFLCGNEYSNSEYNNFIIGLLIIFELFAIIPFIIDIIELLIFKYIILEPDQTSFKFDYYEYCNLRYNKFLKQYEVYHSGGSPDSSSGWETVPVSLLQKYVTTCCLRFPSKNYKMDLQKYDNKIFYNKDVVEAYIKYKKKSDITVENFHVENYKKF